MDDETAAHQRAGSAGTPTVSTTGFTTHEPVGTTIGGRYRIIRLIATGGMARVYEAMDEVLSRPVAVKILHGHLVSDDAFVERFHHEAIASARLSHPSIVSIFDTVSESDMAGAGCEAIVMELVHGTTLRRRLDAVGTLSVDEAVAVGAQVADALDTAHRARVVHRDIKPANILLSTDGRVLVADFGIAKAAEGHDLTAEGSMLGTAKYLAPEQVEGTDVDGRADIYALGIVLFEALCGRVPFLADTDTGTALARLHQAPLRPRQVDAAIPRAIEDVVMRAMARHRGDRYDDAAQFRAALLGCVQHHPSIEITVDDTLPGATPHETAIGADSPLEHTPVPESRAVESDHFEVEPVGGFGRSERAWLVPTLLIVLVAVALGVVGVLFGQSRSNDHALGSPGDHTTTIVATTPRITAVHAFDPPPGDNAENDGQLPNLLDGDPTTVWKTETYEAKPEFGVKAGVGVAFTLADRSELTSLTVESGTEGWDGEVYVASMPTDDTLASWGRPLDTKQGIAPGTTTFDLHAKSGDRVLLWITRPGPTGRVAISGVQIQ